MGGERKPGDSWAVARNVLARQFKTTARLEISFEYRGVRCREPIKLPPTTANIRYAERTLAEIEGAIERKTFRYQDYFPDSERARLFGNIVAQRLMKELLSDHLSLCEKAVDKGNMSKSTVDGYRKIIENVLIPEFGEIRARDLTAADVKRWVLKQDSTAKRVRNVLSPLRMVMAEALNDGEVEQNPLDRLDLGVLLAKTAAPSEYEVDPFTSEERVAILGACRTDQERNMYEFWFETGLRTGELIALRWSHIDWLRKLARVETNFTAGVEKAPKTKAGFRDVELTPDAIAALTRQKSLTALADRHIFLNPRTGEPWEGDAPIRKTSWDHTCRLAGIRRRNPYQIRHTWGSRMVSSGFNMFWIGEQMGHETIEMIIKHYGKWMPGEGIRKHEKNAQASPEAITQKVVPIKRG